MNTSCDFAAIPAPLAEREQWVCWRPVDRGGKPTKVPINCRNSKLADSSDPATWATLEEAIPYARRHSCGVGYVFAADDPFVGVDLDDCFDPESGELADWAMFIVWHLASYTEVSPSGTGVHLWMRGTLPSGRRRAGHIELYDRLRFFTVTGHALTGAPLADAAMPVAERTAELTALHALIFPARPVVVPTRQPLPTGMLTDAEVIARASDAANGQKFRALWAGDSSAYGSQSEADAALVNLLRFWVGDDEGRIDQLFRQSGLVRDKWDRPDYRRRTLALASDGALYAPSPLVVPRPQHRPPSGRLQRPPDYLRHERAS